MSQDFNIIIHIDLVEVSEQIKQINSKSHSLPFIPANIGYKKIRINLTLLHIENTLKRVEKVNPDIKKRTRLISSFLKIFIPLISLLDNGIDFKQSRKIMTSSIVLSHLKVKGFKFSIRSNMEIRHLFPTENLENYVGIKSFP